MTTTTYLTTRLRLRRAVRLLPPPAERRKIRDSARLSREDVAVELRSEGIQVTATAIAWWEKEKIDGGIDPRPDKAVAYKRVLDRIQRDVQQWPATAANTHERAQ